MLIRDIVIAFSQIKVFTVRNVVHLQNSLIEQSAFLQFNIAAVNMQTILPWGNIESLKSSDS